MNDGLNIDLHTHSNCSDGSLSPAALIERAAAAGVQVLALTDHDTVAGLEEAQRAAPASVASVGPGRGNLGSLARAGDSCVGLVDRSRLARSCARALRAQAELRRARMRKICARLEKLQAAGR